MIRRHPILVGGAGGAVAWAAVFWFLYSRHDYESALYGSLQFTMWIPDQVARWIAGSTEAVGFIVFPAISLVYWVSIGATVGAGVRLLRPYGTRVLLMAAAGVLLAIAAGYWYVANYVPPFCYPSLPQFAERVRRSVNAAELHAWAAAEVDSTKTTNSTVILYYSTLPRSVLELVPSIRSTGPYSPGCEAALFREPQGPRVVISWVGSHDLRYELFVVSTNDLMRESPDCIKCAPGIYAVRPFANVERSPTNRASQPPPLHDVQDHR